MSRGRLTVAFVAVAIAGATSGAAPVVIPWTAAGEHVDRLVTVEGVVTRARTTVERRCILEFDPDDPTALRVVLLIPLVSDLPPEPHRLYQDKRVQVTGRVMRFQGRPEMTVVPTQIEVVGLTATEPRPPERSEPAPMHAPPPAPKPPPPATKPAAAPAPAPAPPAATAPIAPAPEPAPPAAAPPSVPAPAPAPAPVPPPPDPVCRTLGAEQTALRAELSDATRALQDCLAEGRGGCAALGDRLGPLLSRLDAVEQQLARRCP